MMALLLKHKADPSMENSEKESVTKLVEQLNRPEYLQLLDGSSPLLTKSDEELTQGSSKARIEDYDDPSKLEIPEQQGTDPYTRYKDPQSVLDHLQRKSFEDIPQNQQVLQRLRDSGKFKPKVQEVKSKRLTPQQRKQQKWTRSTGGEERQKILEKKNENQEKLDFDALLEEAEMNALQEQEKNNQKGNKTKSKQAQQQKQEPQPVQQKQTPQPVQQKQEKVEVPQKQKTETNTQTTTTNKNASEQEKRPAARGRKIKKTLKRVSSSSSDEENTSDEIDDDIVVLPSYHNKTQTKPNPPNEVSNEQPKPETTTNNTQQNSQQSPSASAEQYNLTQLLLENNKMLTQQQQLLIQQLMAQQANYPVYNSYMMAPPPQPMTQMPMQQPMPNMYPYMMQQPMMPPMSPSPIMNVTNDEFQKLAAKVASLEMILAPALKQSITNQGQPLGICQNCQIQNANSVCPKCGNHFCSACRSIHDNQRCT